MAKLTLEFDYYEDRDEIERILHSPDAYSALHDIDEMLRSRIKHFNISTDELKFLEQLRQLTYNPLKYDS